MTTNISDTLHQGESIEVKTLISGARVFPMGSIASIESKTVMIKFDSAFVTDDYEQLIGTEVLLKRVVDGRQLEWPSIIQKISENNICIEPKIEEQREFLRLRTQLTLSYEKIEEADYDKIVSELNTSSRKQDDLQIETSSFFVSDEITEQVNDQYSRLLNLMKTIDSKMDYLIGLAEDDDFERTVSHNVHLIDISGAGLGFYAPQSLEIGTKLKTKITLSRFPELSIICISKVIRCGEKTDDEGKRKWDVGTLFEVIHQDDRERIFRYISRSQRTMLRNRSDAMADKS